MGGCALLELFGHGSVLWTLVLRCLFEHVSVPARCWSCCLGMCDSVGRCACWGADPRALLCADAGAVFGHVSVPAWGAEYVL